MDHIDRHLATATINDKYSPAIQAAVTLEKRTLNWCYDIMDHLELYHIAMHMYYVSFISSEFKLIFLSVLHASGCHKLQYFQKAYWDLE